MKKKRKFIYTLIVLVVILLLANVFLSLFDTKEPEFETKSLSKEKIENRFRKVLKGFKIEDAWIKKKKVSMGKNDSLHYKYIVKIPTDVPIPLILKDVYEVFNNSPVTIKSTEIKINGRTNLSLESNQYKKLSCDFIYENSLKRKFSNIAFLITDGDKLDENELNSLLSHPIKFGIILPLETESEITAQKIKDRGKEYFIELNDDSDNINFELSEDVNMDKFNLHLKKIISSFNSPRIFFVNTNTSGFSTSTEKYITENFKKKGRKILHTNSFVNLKAESEVDLISLLKFHLNTIKPGGKKIFRISYEDFMITESVLNSYFKRGNKIVLPAQIL